MNDESIFINSYMKEQKEQEQVQSSSFPSHKEQVMLDNLFDRSSREHEQ